MKRLILLLIILAPMCVLAQKKNAKTVTPPPTPAQMDSALNDRYNSFNAERENLANMMAQATDTVFSNAIASQAAALEVRCANTMWGYVFNQEPTEYTLQLMYRLRGSVDISIVEGTLQKLQKKFKENQLLESEPLVALKYYVENGSVKLGEKYRNITLESIGEKYPALDLSTIVKEKSVLLILGENEDNAIPASFNVFYGKLDHSTIDVVHVKFYKDKVEAVTAMTEKKEPWTVYPDASGAYSKVILDYNVVATPACFLLEKGSGKILYEGEGVADDLMGLLLTM